jgi:hypothetical protein
MLTILAAETLTGSTLLVAGRGVADFSGLPRGVGVAETFNLRSLHQ